MKTTAEILKEYKTLFDEGAITQEEFSRLKKNVLAKGNIQYKEATDKADPKKEPSVISASQQMKSQSVSREAKEKATQWGCLVILIIMVVLVFKGCSWLLSDNDDPAASLDYGKDYYYDSGTHKVERSLHGILHGAPEP